MPLLKSKVPRAIAEQGINVQLCTGSKAITAKTAKEMLGWKEYAKRDSDTDFYLLRTPDGKWVKCLHNTKNRPLSDGWCKTLAQDILNLNWVVNGETIIIGKSRQILSGQHRLIGLIIADMLWHRDKHKWAKNWPTPPVIEAIIVEGIEEDSRHTRTLDNVKPRSLSDVLFTSELLKDYTTADRYVISRIADYAVRILWHRTGAANAFTPYRTHSESINFIGRHPRILGMVKTIFDLNAEKGISKYMSHGYAAGMMYLMAASNTEGTEYWDADPPPEDLLDLEMEERATDFWSDFAQGKIRGLREALDKLAETETDGVGYEEAIALVVKAWLMYRKNKVVKDLTLRYIRDEDGIRRLGERPILGGIDRGGPVAKGEIENQDEEE
jgi:hypothetical protein